MARTGEPSAPYSVYTLLRPATADPQAYPPPPSARLTRVLWGLFWFFAGTAALLAAIGLRGEKTKRAWIAGKVSEQPAQLPPATVIVPVKGQDEDLAANLACLAELDYPDYELIVAAQRPEDIPAGVVPARARVVLAGPGDPDTGEKIRNLLAGIAAARPESAFFALADSDGKVRPGWLRALAAGLERPRAGAATGYRWYFPDRVTFAALLRSVWNAVIAGLFGPSGAPFAWGGAMAIRRDTFERAGVARHWQKHVSDDWALTQAVRAAGLEVVFAPGAMAAATDATTLAQFSEWSSRQMLLTRIYEPKVWWVSLAGHLLYCGSMVACVAALAAGHAVGGALLAWQIGAGTWKAASRLRTVRTLFPERAPWLDRYAWLHLALTTLVSWAWLACYLRSASSDVIHWRGVRYRLSRAGAKRL
jgi:ceramide glucosyltransferase